MAYPTPERTESGPTESPLRPLFPFMALAAIFLIFSTSTAAQLKSPPSGISYQEVELGSGTPVGEGDVVTIHFTAWIDAEGAKGEMIFNSYDHSTPVTFKIGAEMVIEGWNDGVAGMLPGGTRLLHIPARYAYGEKGSGETIPPDTDLIYEVELIGVR